MIIRELKKGWGAGTAWDTNDCRWGTGPHHFNPGDEVIRLSDHMRGKVRYRERLTATVRWWDRTESIVQQFDPDVWRFFK